MLYCCCWLKFFLLVWDALFLLLLVEVALELVVSPVGLIGSGLFSGWECSEEGELDAERSVSLGGAPRWSCAVASGELLLLFGHEAMLA